MASTNIDPELVVGKPFNQSQDSSSANIVTGQFVNTDGINIYTRTWLPNEGCEKKAILILLHGIGEHCGRYDAFAKKFTERGIIVASHDHVGHGRSDGERAHITDFEIFCRDAFQRMNIILMEYSGLPIYIFGHSMGSIMALSVVLQHQSIFKGVIISASALKVDPATAGPLTIFMAKTLRWIAPRMKVTTLQPEFLSRDKNQVELFINDPLIYHDGVKASIAGAMLSYSQLIIAKLAEITLPILLYHGEADTLTFVGSAHLIFNSVQSQDKEMRIWPECRHELHFEIEPDRTNILDSYVDWIMKRL